jgi:hypothetical protein
MHRMDGGRSEVGGEGVGARVGVLVGVLAQGLQVGGGGEWGSRQVVPLFSRIAS